MLARVGGACACLLLTVSHSEAAPLTLERLLTEPAITGTAPSDPAWAPDSRKLAFLWNDRGTAGRELWLTNRRGDELRRLTESAAGSITGFAWTPGSESIVFLSGGQLRVVAASGAKARTLHASPTRKSHLGVSPDGRYAAFLAGGDLWRVPLAGGDAERLTNVGRPATSSVEVGQYSRPEVEIGTGIWGGPTWAWSPDGRYIAVHHVDRRHMREVPFPWYLSEETLPNHVRRGYPGDANEARTVGILDLTLGRFELLDLPEPTANQIVGFTWSPDNRLLIDRASDTNVDRWLDIVAPANGTRREVWHGKRETRVYTAFSSAWHPDGEHILFASDIDDRYGLYRLDPDSGQHERLTQPGHDLLGDFVVLPESGSVVYHANDPSPHELQSYRVKADGGSPERLTFLAGHNDAVPSPDGTVIAFVHSDDVNPPDLYVAATGKRSARRVTVSPPDEFNQRSWARARYVTFPSRVDDFTLHARILTPPMLEPGCRYPVVFGPVYSNTVRNRWSGLYDALQQLLVDRGYVVVQVDVRGSTGYGRAFREAFLADFAGGDIEDLASAVQYLETLPYIDPERMGIWGSSYGGTLAVYSLLMKPGLFRAGVAGAAAVDPRFFGPDDIAIVRRPETRPEIFERTALKHAANLEDHLLFIHGIQDQVVPFKTTAVLAEELMRQGKDFEFAFAPGATHGWTRQPHHARYLLGRMLHHFDRYLSNRCH